jgi:diaminopimelate epimerase
LGRKLQGDFPDGVNVEFVTLGPAPDSLTLRVWERGVGETLACGTGSAAAAAAAHEWGLVGSTVDVHNPGGTLRVELGEAAVVLSGPVAFVADIRVRPEALLAGRHP